MTFTSFALPVLPPRRWDLVALGLLFAGFYALDRALGLHLGPALAVDAPRVSQQPWRLLGYALLQADAWKAVGVALSVPVGLTMVARCSGRWAAWVGALLGTLLGGLLTWWWQDVPRLGASSLLYTSLGMASVAWFRMREELTYARRVDWIAGFGTLLLVAAALGVPPLMKQPFHAEYLACAVLGVVVVVAAPRHYESVMR